MNFRNLEVYQTAIRFLPLATSMADRFPPRYAAMADQLRRAALSIPLNIAEGSGKITGPDQRRFYSIARGSAMECAAIVDACSALVLIEQIHTQEADKLLLSVVRMLSKMCQI
jgi:four helix bundle protein